MPEIIPDKKDKYSKEEDVVVDKDAYERAAGREQERPESTPPQPVMNAGLILYIIILVMIAGAIAALAVPVVDEIFSILGIK